MVSSQWAGSRYHPEPLDLRGSGNEPEGPGSSRQATLSRASSADGAGGIEALQFQ